MSDWRKRFNRRFEELKENPAIKLTQERLAEMVGVDQSAISHWRRGTRSPESIEQYERLAEAIGMHPAELLFGIPISNNNMHPLMSLAPEWKELDDSERANFSVQIRAVAERKRTN